MMDEIGLVDLIEQLAVEVEDIGRHAYIDICKSPPHEAGADDGKIIRVKPEEYLRWGYLDKTDKHSIILRVFKDIVSRAPAGQSRLYWREKPGWETMEDFDTRQTKGIIYCRLGWLQLAELQ